MGGRLGVWLAVKLMRSARLSLEDRSLLTTTVLNALHALPLQAIISTGSSGEVLINGQPLDIEQVRQLRDSARVALNNKALGVIREQVAWVAVTTGVHKVERDIYQLLFARAALWWSQQVQEHLELLAQKYEEPTL